MNFTISYQWIKENKSEEYKSYNSKRRYQDYISIKQDIVYDFQRVRNQKYTISTWIQKGVYFAMMYDNGNEFLRNEIDESQLKMKKKFEEGDDYTIRWWKKKVEDTLSYTMKTD